MWNNQAASKVLKKRWTVRRDISYKEIIVTPFYAFCLPLEWDPDPGPFLLLRSHSRSSLTVFPSLPWTHLSSSQMQGLCFVLTLSGALPSGSLKCWVLLTRVSKQPSLPIPTQGPPPQASPWFICMDSSLRSVHLFVYFRGGEPLFCQGPFEYLWLHSRAIPNYQLTN